MQVEYGLLSNSAGGADQVHSRRRDSAMNGAADLDNCAHQICAECVIQRPKIRHMHPGYDECMPRSCGLGWEKGNPTCSFADYFRCPILSARNATERTVTAQALSLGGHTYDFALLYAASTH